MGAFGRASGSGAAAPTPTARSAETTPLRQLLWPTASARLTDADGRVLTPAFLRDKVILVSFFTTGCAAPCAVRQVELTRVLRALPPGARARVLVLALSGDVTHDAPVALKAFAAEMHLDPDRHILVSAGADDERMRLLGWRPPAGAPDPVPPMVYAFDRKGQFAMRYSGAAIDRRRLTQDLQSLSALDQGVGTHAAPAQKSF